MQTIVLHIVVHLSVKQLSYFIDTLYTILDVLLYYTSANDLRHVVIVIKLLYSTVCID